MGIKFESLLLCDMQCTSVLYISCKSDEIDRVINEWEREYRNALSRLVEMHSYVDDNGKWVIPDDSFLPIALPQSVYNGNEYLRGDLFDEWSADQLADLYQRSENGWYLIKNISAYYTINIKDFGLEIELNHVGLYFRDGDYFACENSAWYSTIHDIAKKYPIKWAAYIGSWFSDVRCGDVLTDDLFGDSDLFPYVYVFMENQLSDVIANTDYEDLEDIEPHTIKNSIRQFMPDRIITPEHLEIYLNLARKMDDVSFIAELIDYSKTLIRKEFLSLDD